MAYRDFTLERVTQDFGVTTREAELFPGPHPVEVPSWLVETLAKEEELQTLAGESADHTIAVDAFLAKETPRFTGR